MFSSIKSICGNKICQFSVANFGDVKVYPLKNKVDAHMALSQYFKYVGVPASLHIYNDKDTDVRNKWKNVISK